MLHELFVVMKRRRERDSEVSAQSTKEKHQLQQDLQNINNRLFSLQPTPQSTSAAFSLSTFSTYTSAASTALISTEIVITSLFS